MHTQLCSTQPAFVLQKTIVLFNIPRARHSVKKPSPSAARFDAMKTVSFAAMEARMRKADSLSSTAYMSIREPYFSTRVAQCAALSPPGIRRLESRQTNVFRSTATASNESTYAGSTESLWRNTYSSYTSVLLL